MKLVIYGTGNFAELMAYYFTVDSDYEVVAFCADEAYITKNDLNGIPVVSFENINDIYPSDKYAMFVAVGYKSMRNRKKMYKKAKNKGYTCASYLSSKSMYDKSNSIGENSALLYGSILEPFVKVSDNCMVNTGTILCHHSQIKENCFIAAKSIVGGFTIVGESSFIGFNATILQKLTLKEETLVAAGSVLVHDTQLSTQYRGVPAKRVSSHHENGIEIVD